MWEQIKLAIISGEKQNIRTKRMKVRGSVVSLTPLQLETRFGDKITWI